MDANQLGLLMSNYQLSYSSDAMKCCIHTLCHRYRCLVTFLPYHLHLCSDHVDHICNLLNECCDNSHLYEILLTIEEKKNKNYGIVNLIWDECHFIEIDKQEGIEKFGNDYKALRDYPVITKMLEESCETTIIHSIPEIIN